ncbi:nestin [Tachysurus vachellii]|uniref:nestin n=1 Tax=Tachysurus vachellii TaxID=175792 RepID=UPI00296B2888|nr:nestin [Tachysurus vachellii]
MEIFSSRHPLSSTGAEKYEMLELNRRLESYLNHVKLLEEENQLLWGEIQAMRRNQDTGGQRKAQEEALSLARNELQNTWREKDCVELEVSNMLQEIEELNILRQKERSAQTEAKRKLEESRKTLEDERRMQIWLREQAAHLEKEISLQVQLHQEDLAALKSSCAFSKPVLMAPQHSQTLNLHGLGEEYSQRAAQAWHEAASVYKTQMKKLEERLTQTMSDMTLIKQEKKESQLQVQDLAKELESAKAKRELIEKNMVQQKQRQNQDIQHLQAHVEALEAEKLDLGEQIGDLLVESRNLLKTKMSLNLEVATYRALLDSESLRVNNQAASKRNRRVSHLEGITKSPEIPPGTQAISSSLFSSPLNTTSRSITHKANLVTPTPTRSLALRTPQETLKRSQTTKEEDVIVREQKQKLETSAIISKKHLNGADSSDHYGAEEEASSAASVSDSVVPNAVDEPESILSINGKEDLHKVLKAEVERVLFSANETATIASLAGHPETPESLTSSQHIEEAKSSEDGDEEETEVSTEMAQISHAPVSAWEENETVIQEVRNLVCEKELESEDIDENCTQDFKMDSDPAEVQLLAENTNTPASMLLQEIPQLSADTFSPFEDDSEILTWADVKEDVLHFVEEESLKSVPEVKRESEEGTEEVQEKMEVETEWPGIEVLEGHEFDITVHEEENETEQAKTVEQEELIYVQEERMIVEEIEESFGKQKAELMMSTCEKVDLIGENAELVMDTYEKDNLVGQKATTVIDAFNKDQLVEYNAEEEQRQSDEDESLNISASWKTDPGEADSYAQENTLADTRPLIHYKSDEETDANIPISHLGVSEHIDSEEEREKHEGGSNRSQIIAKRFDTMEDLSEEPELGSIDDIITDESAQNELRESMSEETDIHNESGEIDSHVKMDDGLFDKSESDLRYNSNENSLGEDETKIENYHLSTVLVEKQEEGSQLPDGSASFYSETSKQQTLLTTKSNISEVALTENRDNADNMNVESIEINLADESEDKKYFDTPLPEPSQEQSLAEEPFEEISTDITPSDDPLYETDITEEHVCPKEEDVQSNLSMLTHADFTDEFSPHNHPDSQTIKDSDLEEPNSSEDESSNESQCSQLLSQSEMHAHQLEKDSASTMDVVSNTDPFFTGLVSGVMKKESSESCNDLQAEDLENNEEQQHAVDSSGGVLGENAESLSQEWENLGHEITSASHSIHSTAEEFGDLEMENKKENMNIFQGGAMKEECQANEKDNDHNSFFSSSIKEGIWSATNTEIAATYDPNNQTETERYSDKSINPNQTMAFGEDWGNLEVPTTNSKPEKDMDTSMIQTTEKGGEEQKMPHTKHVQSRDGDKETVNAEDSTDEGDSWSSGEE